MLSRLLAEFARAAAEGHEERAEAIARVSISLRDLLARHTSQEVLVLLLDSEGSSSPLLEQVVAHLTEHLGPAPVFVVVDSTHSSVASLGVEPDTDLVLALSDLLGPDSVALVTRDDA